MAEREAERVAAARPLWPQHTGCLSGQKDYSGGLTPDDSAVKYAAAAAQKAAAAAKTASRKGAFLMIEKLLGSKLRAKLLGWLVLHRGESFFSRQLESLIGGYSANISRELTKLEQMGVVVSRVSGQQKYYQINPDCAFLPELEGFILKTVGLAGPVRKALGPFKEDISVAFVYGSHAAGEQRADSDVDVMVVGNTGFAPVASSLAATQETLGREVNTTVYGTDEFRRKLRNGDHFISSVVAGPKIFLWGDENDLTRLGEEESPREPHNKPARDSRHASHGRPASDRRRERGKGGQS
jgi:predicted nucleotidyltransferase